MLPSVRLQALLQLREQLQDELRDLNEAIKQTKRLARLEKILIRYE